MLARSPPGLLGPDHFSVDTTSNVRQLHVFAQGLSLVARSLFPAHAACQSARGLKNPQPGVTFKQKPPECIAAPVPSPHGWFPEFCNEIDFQLPRVVTDLIVHSFLASFPFPASLPPPLPVCPRSLSK